MSTQILGSSKKEKKQLYKTFQFRVKREKYCGS